MLKLEITSYQKASSEQIVSMQLEQGALRIGRDSSNDWSLTDPARVMSKHHCTVERFGNEYFVTDNSTNGVFINTASDPLGRGNQTKLSDGDTIRISDYEIMVGIDMAVEPAAPEVETPKVDNTAHLQAPPPPPPVNVPADGGDWKAMLEEQSAPAESHTTSQPKLAVDVPDLAQSHYDAPNVGMSIPEDWSSAASAPAATAEQPVTPVIPEADFSTQQPGVEAEPIAEPVRPTEPNRESHPTQSTEPAEKLISAFLRGAGLPADTAVPVNQQELMQELGGLFRQMTMGLMGVLAARGDIKSEFRLSQTMIRPTENNPLKFSLNIDEALIALLSKRGQGYMSADAAFDEAFEDIKAHQLAVLTGMQSAMKNLLLRLEPNRIKGKDDDKKGMQKLLGGQKSKYWDEYVLLYKTLFQQSEDDFQTLFGHEFSKAYEQQIQQQKSQLNKS